ncbi:bifunctional diaminohydroxyphosphoribosylaminopyrimidine deaminase/5-amino-6-(5-phosphoribosylamino)uracil reductase RibD (plasmid) [Azospirillum thermophilum]|uniref:Riboflavin biosynthesis protein RibD n=2 Tax=Azospirillum thermophilum TaxID=2202148 RepID=A0A2S2CX65_9PROT|nr:bifunctional diaminohydroxyphosphoribosylaminopyrimidine deaminase/5-amino-6-(5-phosphoribosylamino)uracil reductase RibD [Azospirillum thermophilum]
MDRALLLAERGRYTTKPNPVVGCVIAHDAEVVGEGWHHRAGEPHAEVHALRQAGARARGATAYVTLEPCAHHGRTPPCWSALVEAGIRRVVIAHEDPFAKVNGRGIRALREAGVEVSVGLGRERARELNIGFLVNAERGRPWVRLKFGASLDGRTALADGRSQWITGPEARADVQRWRARSSAILTGSGTVLADDPRLTVRMTDAVEFVPPVRVVLDGRRTVPREARVLDGSAPTLLVHQAGPDMPSDLDRAVERLAIPARNGHLDLALLMAELGRRNLHEVLVEAGAVLGGALVAAGLVDELLLYLAPSILGDTALPLMRMPPLRDLGQATRFDVRDIRSCGEDVRLVLRPRQQPGA